MPFDPDKLRNSYSVVRHGTSTAIEEGVIVSEMRRGISDYGLSAAGRRQVAASALRAIKGRMWKKKPIIFASPFLRARETAEIIARALGIPEEEIQIFRTLSERYFGEWERTSNKNYERAWEIDAIDWKHKQRGVESVFEMDSRVFTPIRKAEMRYSGEEIILATHGDPAQIIETGFKKIHPSQHRSLPTLQPGEIRRLNRAA